MNWETKSLIEDVDNIKRKIDDAVTTFVWFDEDYFKYDRNHTLTNDQIKMHGLKYHEQHRYITQRIDLLSIYLKELDTVLEEIENASSSTDQSKDNA